MVFLAKMIGMALVAVGVLVMVRPSAVKQILDFWKEGNRLYGMGVVRIVVGVILLLAARESAIPWLVAIIGLLPITGGIVIFVMGLDKSKKLIELWHSKPNKVYRKFSVIPIAIGAVLILAL